MVDRYLKQLIVVISIILLFGSCVDIINPKERNKLVFNNNIKSVEDSINVMNEILKGINSSNFTYGISDSNELYINNHKIGFLTDTLLYNKNELNFIEKVELNRFINLVIFLSKNYLGRCDIENNQCIYMYRANIYMADCQDDLDRYVIFVKFKNDIDLNKYKILDNYKNLYLLAYKDAKIWEGELK